MRTPEEKTGPDIEQIGKVRWGFELSGYAGGLEGLGKKIDPNASEYFLMMIFAREVAIGTKFPTSVQQDPRLLAQNLIERGILTAQERDYVYSQFEFDSEKFEFNKNK